MKESFNAGLIFLLVLIYSGFFFLFYIKYVPLIPFFQLVLVPLLLAVIGISAIKIEWGIYGFIVLAPLINILPYLFGIDGSIPHAPAALILFLAFFLGWLLNVLMRPGRPRLHHPIIKPMMLLSLIIVISGVVTFLRFMNFFPFLSEGIHELIVNVNGVRSGGAMMNTVFTGLNYLTGFAFFLILLDVIKSRESARKALAFLILATWLSVMFALVQRYVDPSLGNTQVWVNLNRINGTFKDPNSFGVYLAAVIPLLIGVLFYSKWRLKICIVFLVLCSLFVFPVIGSRSALLGLIGSFSLFFALSIRGLLKTHKLKPFHVIAFFLAVVVVISSFFLFFESSVLSKRIEKDLAGIANVDYLPALFSQRLDFWSVSAQMIKEYPVSGVGLGAYIIELPNYLRAKGLAYRHTDSAENYFLHLGSELGLVGLFLSFWLVYAIFKFIRKGQRGLVHMGREKYLYIGATSGVFAIFINLILHSYVGSYEVKYLFWFLFSIICVYTAEQVDERNKKMGVRWPVLAIMFLVAVFGAIHLWNSARSLSLNERARKYGWNQNYGIYALEKDEKGEAFFWTHRTAGYTVDRLGDSLVLPIRAAHPNVTKYPVTMRLYSADGYFNRGDLVFEQELNHNDWVEIELQIESSHEKKIHLVIETSRAWQPSRHFKSRDRRWLGIGMRRPWFQYADKTEFETAEIVQEFSFNNWQGEHKDKLWVNGVSHMNIEVEKGGGYLCLNLLGQKAFDIGPHIIVRLDGDILGETLLTEEGWASLVFEEELKVGEHEVSIEFINNYKSDAPGNDTEDRNVYLGDVEIITRLRE